MTRTPSLIAVPQPPLIELYRNKGAKSSDGHRISIFAGIGLHPQRRESRVPPPRHLPWGPALRFAPAEMTKIYAPPGCCSAASQACSARLRRRRSLLSADQTSSIL